MEEGLFRGLLLTHFTCRFSAFRSNLLQSMIFGLWHIVWPLRDYIEGNMTLSDAVFISLGYILLSCIIGFSYGFLYLKTNSLWTSVIAHTLNNTAFNFFHTVTGATKDTAFGLRVCVTVFIVFGLLFIVNIVMKKYHSPAFRSWKQ
jgi:membrane protease YdiL (CAAX protease family)